MPVTKPCDYCGKNVTKSKSQMLGKVFCNRDCYLKSKQGERPTTKVCEFCQKEFKKMPKNTWEFFETQRFCTHDCYAKSMEGVSKPEESQRFKALWQDESYLIKMSKRKETAELNRLKKEEKVAETPVKPKKFPRKYAPLSDETKLKISNTLKECWKDSEFYETHVDFSKHAISFAQEKIKRGEVNLATNKGKKRPEQGYVLRELWKDPIFRANKIKQVKESWNDPKYARDIAVKRAKYCRTNPTSIEKKVGEILLSLDIEFETQVPFNRYTVDFYIPSGKKVIEADGDYWHSRPDTKARDKRKDSFLKDQGYRILRLTEAEINQDPLPKIIEFLKR